MAIKGKSRRRSRAKGVHSPPKPQITSKKVPFLARQDVRRTLAVVLGVLVMLGGLRVWQNAHRADALRDYLTALGKGIAPYTAHLGAESPNALDKNVGEFTSAKVGVPEFLKLAGQWEKDFGAARDNVRKLTPPHQMRSAKTWLLQGFDDLIGAVRLFNVAAQQRAFADLPAQSKVQQKLENQVQVVLQHAGEALTRARSAYQKGLDVLAGYGSSWHISDTPVVSNPG
jgi:hypothetical protein